MPIAGRASFCSRMASVAGLAFALTGAACASVRSDCPLRSRAERRLGYEVEWTAREDSRKLDRLCGTVGGRAIRMEVAVLRGTGNFRVGARLRRELEPLLLEHFELDGWSLSCHARSFVITLNAKREACHVDRVIEVVGAYLRGRHASDRVVVRMGLWAAPAL